MNQITLPIYNSEAKEVESAKLDAAVFGGAINTAAIYQAVCAYRANQRKGQAATKTRGEVSGGGRKPWRQKGTGRARVGSSRTPLWRHGGVVFGPHPRDFSYTLPKKIKNLALKSALANKVEENNLIILDTLKIENAKTKAVAKILAHFKLVPKHKQRNYKILLLLEKLDNPLKRTLGNISFLDVNLAKDTHAYEVLRHQKLMITKEGLEQLVERLKK